MGWTGIRSRAGTGSIRQLWKYWRISQGVIQLPSGRSFTRFIGSQSAIVADSGVSLPTLFPDATRRTTSSIREGIAHKHI